MANNIKFTNDEHYNKHLVLSERILIASIIAKNRLADGSLGISLNEIATILRKDPTCISKEVKHRRIAYLIHCTESNFTRRNKTCAKYGSCTKTGICANKNICHASCKKCISCTVLCDEYEERICKHLKHFPWVCDGCQKKGFCGLNKYFYYPEKADKQYKETLSNSREGIDLNEESFKELDDIISTNLISKKQPLSHIYLANVDKMTVSGRTIYNYFESGLFTAKNIDLPRKVKYRPRYHTKITASLKKKIIQGRAFEDFQKFMAENPDSSIVEMDTVEGVKGGKLLLTLMFISFKFQIAYLIDNKEAINITALFNMLEESLGYDLFKKLFGVILTDNGTEFSNPDALETSQDGKRRCKIFFCHPYSSFEKGSCEKNHEYIRIVYPKGTSFNELVQDIIYEVMSNINSVIRPTEKVSPYILFETKYGAEVINKLKIKKIDSKSVNLSQPR